MNLLIKIGTIIFKIIVIFLILLALMLEYCCKIAQGIKKDNLSGNKEKIIKYYNFNRYPKHYSY